MEIKMLNRFEMRFAELHAPDGRTLPVIEAVFICLLRPDDPTLEASPLYRMTPALARQLRDALTTSLDLAEGQTARPSPDHGAH